MRFRYHPERLQQFLDNFTHHVPGVSIEFREFALRFREFCPLSERLYWSSYRLSRALREVGIEIGSRSCNVKHLANLSWHPGLPDGELVTVPGDKKHGAARRLIRV